MVANLQQTQAQAIAPIAILVRQNYQARADDAKICVQVAGVTVTLPDNPIVGVTSIELMAEQNFSLSGGIHPFGGDPLAVGAGTSFFVSFTAIGWVGELASGPIVGVTGTLPIVATVGPAPNISINPATDIAAGSLSAADKTKLDGLTPGAAVASVTGTAPIVSSGGTTPAISITAATGGAAGSMSAADKTKLDGLTPGAAVASVTGTAPIVSSGGTTPAVSITAATGGAAGSMSAADKTKLDTMNAGAAVALVTGVDPIVSSGGTSPAISFANTHTSIAATTTIATENTLVEVTASPGVVAKIGNGIARMTVKDRTNAANPVIGISTQGGVITIEDPNNPGVNASFAATVFLKTQGGSVQLRFNGTSYVIVGSA